MKKLIILLTLLIPSVAAAQWGRLSPQGGTITGIVAGDGLTGGGAAGTVTLNIACGIGLSCSTDQVSVNTSDFRYTEITTSAITGTTNNWDPSGTLSFSWSTARASSSAAATVTGIINGQSGRRITILNVGSNNISFSPEDALSTAANRLRTAGSVTWILQGWSASSGVDSITFEYDGTLSRWQMIGRSGTILPAALIASTLDVNGNATLGDSTTDAHTFNGSINVVGGPYKGGGTTGRIRLGQQILTAPSGTYTPTSGTHAVLIEMVGGAGGSGGCGATGLGAGGGGASGAYWIKWIDAGGSTAITGGAYVVGAGGSAGASGGASNAGTGGDTTLIVTGSPGSPGYVAKGGTGGNGDTGSTSSHIIAAGTKQTSSTGSDITNQGDGWPAFTTTTTLAYSGTGGSNTLGMGGMGGPASTAHAGIAGTGYGAGAGGAACSGANQAGAAGTAGVIIITEFF